jgi:hypothetical protein
MMDKKCPFNDGGSEWMGYGICHMGIRDEGDGGCNA